MTAFMLQVEATVDGAPEGGGASAQDGPGSPLGVRTSVTKSVPVGADEQTALRALAEQLVAEANAVLHGGDLVQLDDELTADQLGFRLRYRDRTAVLRTRFAQGRAYPELLGVGAADPGRRVELSGPEELGRLILLLLAPPSVPRSAPR